MALAFNAPVADGVVYRIAINTDGVNWDHLGDTAGTTYTATGLNSGTTYYFGARAACGTVYQAPGKLSCYCRAVALPCRLLIREADAWKA